MSDLLRQLRNQVLGQLVVPMVQPRFFVPNERFYTALAEFKGVKFIDAGTGTGELPDEACALGFDMQGIELVRRPGQSPHVEFREAESYPYSDNTWLLMCRPNHSGWVYDTVEAALRRGASALYVSKSSNLTLDLDCYAGRAARVWHDVGQDGECMLLLEPSALEDENCFADVHSRYA
jgi:hypothetical protein